MKDPDNPVLTFRCSRCNKVLTGTVKSKEMKRFVLKHLYNLCTKQGLASYEALKRLNEIDSFRSH